MLTSLNPRQSLFVENYLIDLNGKEAALRAGYTSRGAMVWAAKLLARLGFVATRDGGKTFLLRRAS